MKKISLFCLTVLFGMSVVQAQSLFDVGASVGVPVGDAGDFATFAIAIDLGYLFEISDEFDAGVATGYSHSFGDEIGGGGITVELDDVQFIPLAASGRYEVATDFRLGADVGYAIGINDGNDGGFYYAPRAQYSISDKLDIVAAYRGISRDGDSWDIITVGVEWSIN